MSGGISKGDVAHVADLARLALAGGELDQYTVELASILEHVAAMASLDIEGVAPTSHPVALEQSLRDDTPRSSLTADEALEHAPARSDGYFRVPRIVEDGS